MTRSALTPEQHRRVAQAIREAEGRTSGEIICVLARSSDSYFYPAAFAVTIGLLAASLIAAVLLDRIWIILPIWQFVAAQLLSLATALLLLWRWPALRIRLVPRALRYRRAHRNAIEQFLARNIHVTENRTGVLIFLSLAERYAEIVADAGINAHVPQEKWDAVVSNLVARAAEGDLAAGYEEAVRACGDMLSEMFPPATGDENELNDHLVEI
ncbi:MAG: TPM domain-containing protein [Rhizobiaceae bacterium]|nr:TPM domain-containing protein [Rhizobiaceae bacterium]